VEEIPSIHERYSTKRYNISDVYNKNQKIAGIPITGFNTQFNQDQPSN